MYAALEVGGAARSADGGKSWELVNRSFNGNVDLMDLHGVALGSPRADVSALPTASASGAVATGAIPGRTCTWKNSRLSPIPEACKLLRMILIPSTPASVRTSAVLRGVCCVALTWARPGSALTEV